MKEKKERKKIPAIRLNDSIINWNNVAVVYRSTSVAGRVLVLFTNGIEHYFDGADGVRLWAHFSDQQHYLDDE